MPRAEMCGPVATRGGVGPAFERAAKHSRGRAYRLAARRPPGSVLVAAARRGATWHIEPRADPHTYLDATARPASGSKRPVSPRPTPLQLPPTTSPARARSSTQTAPQHPPRAKACSRRAPQQLSSCWSAHCKQGSRRRPGRLLLPPAHVLVPPSLTSDVKDERFPHVFQRTAEWSPRRASLNSAPNGESAAAARRRSRCRGNAAAVDTVPGPQQRLAAQREPEAWPPEAADIVPSASPVSIGSLSAPSAELAA